MAEMVKLEVVTPDREVVSVETEEVSQLPGRDGLLGVLPGHAPLMSTLSPGIISWMIGDDKEDDIVVAGGFAVIQDDVVTVLAEAAELPAEIDLDQAQESLARLQAQLATAAPDEEDAIRDEIALNDGRIDAVARAE
ncbi:MAG: ATP synthase F1 subunit epsilon [Leptospirillia bacterium]